MSLEKKEIETIEEISTQSTDGNEQPVEYVDATETEIEEALEVKSEDMSESEKAAENFVNNANNDMAALTEKVTNYVSYDKSNAQMMSGILDEFNKLIQSLSEEDKTLTEKAREKHLEAEAKSKELKVLELMPERDEEVINKLTDDIASLTRDSMALFEAAGKVRVMMEKFRKVIVSADVIDQYFKSAIRLVNEAIRKFKENPTKIGSKSLDRPIALFLQNANVIARGKINEAFNALLTKIYNMDKSFVKMSMPKDKFVTAMDAALENEVINLRDYLICEQYNYNKVNAEAIENKTVPAVPMESVNVQNMKTLYKLIFLLGVENVEDGYKASAYNKFVSVVLNGAYREIMTTFTETVVSTIMGWSHDGTINIEVFIKNISMEEAAVEVAKIEDKEAVMKNKVYKHLGEGVLAGEISKSALTPEQLAGIAALGIDLSGVADNTSKPDITPEMIQNLDKQLADMEDKHGPLPKEVLASVGIKDEADNGADTQEPEISTEEKKEKE